MSQQNEIVRLHTLIANMLELDESYVKDKLEPLKDEIINTVASNKKFIIPGVLEIKPIILEPGSFLNTTKNEYVDVPSRISPRVKLQHRFVLAIKKLRLKKLNFF